MTAQTSITPFHDPRSGRRVGWALSKNCLVRVCGLPAEVMTQFRSPRLMGWLQALEQIEQSLEAQGAVIRSILEARIGDGPGDKDPSHVALINLRRDIFNARRPRPIVLERAGVALSEPERDLIDTWIRTLESVKALRRLGSPTLEGELDDDLPARRALLADPSLRSAVLLQASDLEAQLDRYLNPERRLTKVTRQVERSMVEFLWRAAGKTSPFSSLTSVAFGEFVPEAVQEPPTFDPAERGSTVRPNLSILARIAHVIQASPELRSRLGVDLVPGVTSQEDLIRFVRRRHVALQQSLGPVDADSISEHLYFVPRGPAVQDVMDLVPQVPTLADLIARVAAKGEGRTVGQVETLVGHLLRIGLLVIPELQVDLRHPDPFRSFHEALDKSGDDTLRDVARCALELAELAERFRDAPVHERPDVLRLGEEAASRLFAILQADPKNVPKVVFYEDVVHGPHVLQLDREGLANQVEQDLSNLAELLPIFDQRAAYREALAGFFHARFGPGGVCEDFLRFAHEFHTDFFEQFNNRMMRRSAFDEDNNVAPQENWFKSPVIERLDAARSLASKLLMQQVHAQPGRVVHLGDSYVEAVRHTLQSTDTLKIPWSFLAQVVPDDPDGAKLVVNQCYAGMGLLFSRFLNALDEVGVEATEHIRQTLRANCPEGAVLAEVRGAHDSTNLNLHPILTDFEIVCPGDISRRPPAERIHLQDLHVEHDVAWNRVLLRDSRSGREVVPVYLGYLMPLSLPEIHQMLLCFSPMGMATIDLWAGTGERIVIEDVVRYPRIQLGGLVLQREMWKMPRESFPLKEATEDNSEYFHRLHKWRQIHEIPTRVYARVDFFGSDDDEDTGVDHGASTKRKPLGVDFESWYSIQLLERMIRSSNKRIVFTEALPDPDRTWLTDLDGRGHVSELLLEIYPKKED